MNYPTNEVDILYGNNVNIEKNGNRELRIYPKKINKLFFYSDCINHQASFIRRSLFEKFGLYNEQYRIVSDWEKWIIFAKNNCNFQYFDRIVSNFYLNGISFKMSQLLSEEKNEVFNAYFSKKEIHLAKKYNKKLQQELTTSYNYYKLFGKLPLFLIKIAKSGHRKSFYLFTVIELYKIRTFNNCSKHYLFGFIPIIKITKKEQK